MMIGRITDFEAYFGVQLGDIKAPCYLIVWVQTKELTYVNVTWDLKRLWGWQRLSPGIVSKLTRSFVRLGEIQLRLNRNGRLVIFDNDLIRWIRLAKQHKTQPIEKKYNFGWMKNYLEKKDTTHISDQMCIIRKDDEDKGWYLKTPQCIPFGNIHQLSPEAKAALDKHSESCQYCDYKLFLISIGQSRDQNMAELGFDPYDSGYGLTLKEIESMVG